MGLLFQAIAVLSIPMLLPPKYLDHPLYGQYLSYRECHIQPDWILVYRYYENELRLHRTGTHADIFYFIIKVLYLEDDVKHYLPNVL